MTAPLIVILVTVGSEQQGREIAAHLVGEQLAACVNLIGPIHSVYWWQGAVQDDTEWQLLIKTRRDLFAAVESAVRARHSYENPEILALPVEAAADAYAAWITSSTRA